MAKRKKSRRKMTGRSPEAPRPLSPLDQMRDSAAALVKEGKAEAAVGLLLDAVEAVLRQNRNLELMVMKFQREHAGKKSEKVDGKQLSLMFEDLVESSEEDPDAARGAEEREDAKLDEEIDHRASSAPEEARKKRTRNGWKAKDIERREKLHELPPEKRGCQECGTTKEPMGEEVTRRLVFVPGHFIEEVHRCVKYACRKCREGSIPTAPAPPQVIERSVADATLLAHVVVSKYQDHNPLTRLNGIYARTGVEISVSTLSDWVAQVGDLLAPIAEENEKRVHASYVIGTDATGIKVLDPKDPENIRRGTMWCYIGDRKHVVFRYTPTGEGATGPWTFLEGRKGYVQADAHSVYDRLFLGTIAQAVEVGCWSHGRRRFYAMKDVDNRVAYPILWIRRLYRLEHLADLRNLDGEERARFRQERSQSVLDRLKWWAVKTTTNEPPDSEIAKASAYLLNHWEALTRFVSDGRLDLDNNLVEQQIRYVALGRKNYLFCGSDGAAVRAARLYGILRTCSLHRVPPLPYLTDVLQKLAAGWPHSRLAELLPDRWLQDHGSPQHAILRS